ncbi:hypothetical protein Leryth_016592 [Lithospermum erythrorhizon]|nr:hypothetical protein Leryth_016592 [Lithospermum erythrorhizon]
MPLADLYDPHKGYLVDDTCIIEATVEVQSVVPPKESAKSIAEGSSSQSEKSPAKGHVVIENTKSNPLPSLFHHFGLLKVRNPPYSLPNVYRITEGTGLDDGDIASRLIQSSLISSELQPFLEMPVADLEKQGYFHLAKFLHYHCASIVSAQGLQIKHQEHANALEELQLSLENSAKEASQLRGDLQKAVEEKAKDAEELSPAKQKIINLEGEPKLLFSENVDLQIQLEDSRKAVENAVTQAVEDFKASNDHNDELRAMAVNSLKQATELFCTRLKNKLPMFDPSMLDKLAGDAQASLANEADDAA